MGDRLLYAKRHYQVLLSQDAQELLGLSSEKRKHAMKALASLAKYMGNYDTWKAVRERYQLKWSSEDSLQSFSDIFNKEKNLTATLNWLKDTITKIPSSYGRILLFDALTGLRPDEACHSISLIRRGADNYLNEEFGTLEHFKYPAIFIRRTKKAYISITTEPLIELAKKSGDHTYTAIRMAVVKRGLEMHMKYCRRIFATYLRSKGVEPEVIDLLQGRIPKTVFARHYFRPDFKYEQIREIVLSLRSAIT